MSSVMVFQEVQCGERGRFELVTGTWHVVKRQDVKDRRRDWIGLRARAIHKLALRGMATGEELVET